MQTLEGGGSPVGHAYWKWSLPHLHSYRPCAVGANLFDLWFTYGQMFSFFACFDFKYTHTGLKGCSGGRIGWPSKRFSCLWFCWSHYFVVAEKSKQDYCARFSFKLTLFISADGKENGRILYDKVISPFNGLKRSFPWTMQKLTLVLKLRMLNWLPAPLN